MDSGSSSKAVIVISSHVARGSVGNRAAVLALEALSVPVWSVPTVVLPWHPGHGPSTRLVPGQAEFALFLKDIRNAPWISEVGAVLSGYLAEPWQAAMIAELVSQLKANNPELVYLCDPVIGDESGLYVPEATATNIREKLIPLADYATPNRFELAWLAGKNPAGSIQQAISQLEGTNLPASLVTTAPGSSTTMTGNLFWDDTVALLAEHEVMENPPNGPGDLTAALFLAHHLSGMPVAKNLEQTTASVVEILRESQARNVDELPLESEMKSITEPEIRISSRQVI